MKSYFSNIAKYSKLSLIPVITLGAFTVSNPVGAQQADTCETGQVNAGTQDTQFITDAPAGTNTLIIRCQSPTAGGDANDGPDTITIGDDVDDTTINIGENSGTPLSVTTNIGDEGSDILNVTGDSTFTGQVTVNNGPLTVNGNNIAVNGGNINTNQSVNAGVNVNAGQDVTAGRNVSAVNNVNAGNNVNVGNNLNVTQDAFINRNLIVDGVSQLDDTNVDGTFNVQNGNTANFSGPVNVSGFTTTTGISNTGALTTDTLEVLGATTLNGLATTNGIANTGAITTDTLDVAGTLEVDGVTTLNGPTILNGLSDSSSEDLLVINSDNSVGVNRNVIGELRKELRTGIASSIAMENAEPELRPGHRYAIGLGFGTFEDETAIGTAAKFLFTDPNSTGTAATFKVSAGWGLNADTFSAGAGLGLSF
ncbi:hypothetical protein FEK30_02290 [Picosynechococcus sp. PCC 11901]|uniref:hypothetical protein n=1 Tax=Picosynechococcus sp. PCC 11901 TaxID=2579791 RepID=UPI0010FBF0CE|nr:hypothetical protein [Picosynechococcus sp. PCC 11901]QCS48358.1 hypothetical protein FEK30_02290 [Picosynechococcus sp. PCC 11901]